MQIYLGGHLQENEFRNELVNHEKIVNIYKFVESLYRKAYSKILPTIRVAILLIFTPVWLTLLVIIIPILYLYLIHVVKKSSDVLKKIQNSIPSLTINQLESIKKVFEDLDKKGMNEALAQSLLDAPALFKPLAYTMKENLDQHFAIKKQINIQIEEDLNLFSIGLEEELPLGISIE